MGGLGPGIGGFEIVVIGLVALLIVGPKDLPVLMRRVGQMVAKARGMANEFRSSFDEMARQSELDDLRKEVEALRGGQGMYPLGKEADEAFRDIKADLDKPLIAAPTPVAALDAPKPADEMVAVEPTPAVVKPKAKRAPTKTAAKAESKPASAKPAKPKAAAKTPAKPRAPRKTAVKS